jgi:hypothetical protein
MAADGKLSLEAHYDIPWMPFVEAMHLTAARANGPWLLVSSVLHWPLQHRVHWLEQTPDARLSCKLEIDTAAGTIRYEDDGPPIAQEAFQDAVLAALRHQWAAKRDGGRAIIAAAMRSSDFHLEIGGDAGFSARLCDGSRWLSSDRAAGIRGSTCRAFTAFRFCGTADLD